MLIKLEVLEKIKSGEITLQFRRWRRRTVKAGGTLKTRVGVLQIGAVHRDACVLLKQGHQASEYVVDWLERFRDAYILEMQHFVDCLRQGTTPAIGIDAGIRALEVAEACIESFKTGLPVDVPHVPDVPDVLGEGRR